MPLSTEDRLEIADLLARYNHAIDFGNAEAWAATFTPDGTFESRGQVHEGTGALLAFARSFAERGPGFRHWNNNPVIEGDGDHARSTCYLQLWHNGELFSRGRYEDELRRVDGCWRFVSRRVIPDA